MKQTKTPHDIMYIYMCVLGVKYFSTFNETLEHFKDV